MNDEYFMEIALREAQKGMGRTSPNPCVGAVITRGNEILAKGWHKRAGMPHAEREALAVAAKNGIDVTGATLYVTLEPCNHTGKTPPCTEAILEAGFSRVVIGMMDPHPLVDGSGVERLRANNIEITLGILEEKCRKINLPFISAITKGRPWVVMKAGVSLDGQLNFRTGERAAITGKASLREGHRLRNRLDGILVGKNTVEIDNPSLTTRLDVKKSRDPIRILLDRNLSLSPALRVFTQKSASATWVFCSDTVSELQIHRYEAEGLRIFTIAEKDDGLDLHQLLRRLAEENICSLLVEGGGSIHASFLAQRLVDYAYLFYAPIFAGDGGIPLVRGFSANGRLQAPRIDPVKLKRCGKDFLVAGPVLYEIEDSSIVS